MPKPAPPSLPEPVERQASPYDLCRRGRWLVLSDVHLPFHDKATVEAAVREAKRVSATGVLLGGDVLDCHELSRWDKSPDDPRYRDEVAMGRQFLAYLRHQLPYAKFVFKDGNHEERLVNYLITRAPALFGLDVLTLPNLLHFNKYRIEHVTDRRVIKLGRLSFIHGHEHRVASQAVNPARGLFLRAKSVALCGHFHQSSEHHEPNIVGKPLGAWSLGCACGLAPFYMPLNKWNHGFAIVEIANNNLDFSVRNLRVLNGEVV